MKIRLIRNACVVVEYSDKKILVDPMLSPKGAFPPFPLSARKERNPLDELPIPAEDVVKGIDAVILTHLHIDHIDEAAYRLIPKDMKIFVQNEKDLRIVRAKGFTDIEVMDGDIRFGNITLVKTPGRHGRLPILLLTGHTSGVILKSDDEKTLYLAGDTIFYSGVKGTLEKYKPEVIILNAGGNKFIFNGPIVMDDNDVLKVHEQLPSATIIAVHMEAVNHYYISRKGLRQFADAHHFGNQLFIPENGDSIEINKY